MYLRGGEGVGNTLCIGEGGGVTRDVFVRGVNP